MDDNLRGSVAVEKNTQTDFYAVSFCPEDFGRGALSRRNLNHEQLVDFFARIKLREVVETEALKNLQTEQFCHIPDLQISRQYLREMNLVD